MMDDKLKSLRAGIEEMRTVAQKLLTWASDLEQSFLSEAPEPEPATPAEDVPVNEPVVAPPPSRAEVKAFLTSRCAAGYSAQVKALIASFGAASLSEVPEDSLSSLMDAASLLGEGDGHAG